MYDLLILSNGGVKKLLEYETQKDVVVNEKIIPEGSNFLVYKIKDDSIEVVTYDKNHYNIPQRKFNEILGDEKIKEVGYHDETDIGEIV